MALSIMKIIINKHAVPTDAARLPYTVNMENRKEKMRISAPSV
jgi:hypothetical protein